MLFQKEYFSNPEIVNVNALADTAYFIPYKTRESALRLNRRDSEYLTFLNGEWDFKLFPSVYDVTERFFDNDFDTSGYDKISVPSVWQFKGYEVPYYVTSPYPIPFDPPNVPYANPLGAYSRKFNIKKRENKKYVISLEGVATAYFLYINGDFIGYAETAHCTTNFDITDSLRDGENKISVAVLKWASSTYIEDQDMYRHNGIFRDLYISEREENGISDIIVNCLLSDNYKKASLSFDVDFINGSGDYTVELYDNGALIASGKEFVLDNPKLWNAENPTLYTVLIINGSEYIPLRVGVRDVKIDNGKILLNGVPIKLHGINHHDSSCEHGFAMTYEEMLEDVRLMKEFNIDSIRTAHYPPSPLFLELCDEYGFYVMCEADMESHGCYYIGDRGTISSAPGYKRAIVDRGVKMVRQNRNFSSIIMWSLGNESGFGANVAAESLAIKELDKRPIHYRDIFNPDLSAYARENVMKNYEENLRQLELTRKYVDVIGFFYPKMDQDFSFFENDGRPVIYAEYSHAMGNSCGDVWEYWERMNAEEYLGGGYIWEFCDHGMKKGDKIVYGGDFGEINDSGAVCMDGIMSADRKPHTAAYEVKNAYAPIRIVPQDAAAGVFEVKNLFSFTSLDKFKIQYSVEELGKVVTAGELSLTTLPLTSEEFKLNYDLDKLSKRSYIIFKVFSGAHEIFMCQYMLPVEEKYSYEKSKKSVTVVDENSKITVRGENFEYAVDKSSGAFTSLKIGSKELLASSTKPVLYRLPTDNDRVLSKKWVDMSTAAYMPPVDYRYPVCFSNFISMKTEESFAEISFDFIYSPLGRPEYKKGRITYKINGDGLIEINESGKINDALNETFPRDGYFFEITPTFDKISYYGLGRSESYCDKHHFEEYGFYDTTAKERTVSNSERIMESGSIFDTSFLALYDKDGDGIAFASCSFSFNASNYDFYEMVKNQPRHRVDARISENINLMIDRKMCGIGSASVGAPLQEKHKIQRGEYSFYLRISPLRKTETPRELASRIMMEKKEDISVVRVKKTDSIVSLDTSELELP